MAEARRNEQWDHTAALLAGIAEPHRDRKKHPRPFSPMEFHPLRRPLRIPGTVEDLRGLATRTRTKGQTHDRAPD